MKLVTWNVQWCRGVDMRVDPARIVAEARRLADFDVLCVQEVADNYPHPRLEGSAGEDQFALLGALLPGYAAVAGVATDHPAQDGRRRRFGNLVLSRLPVRQVLRHLLPSPVDPGENGMARIALEAVVSAPFGDVRVITTHLEWYSLKQRTAQVEALRALYAEGYGHARLGTVVDESGGPLHTYLRPAATILCGDFNLEYEHPLHARIGAPFADGTPALTNAWDVVHAGAPYPATFKVHEKRVPGEPELHCDFFFVSADLLPRVRDLRCDGETRASDHQPVILELA
jgi:endonuclease/exonuclease/phosphatase family metal-dependent hydrolase